jgi:hypothetical protein
MINQQSPVGTDTNSSKQGEAAAVLNKTRDENNEQLRSKSGVSTTENKCTQFCNLL